MSTQHPDNVETPFYSHNCELDGADEVLEAFYVFSHFDADEQMWDCEGKEIDSSVVRKLLAGHEPFFREKKLGQDVFLTLRVPNPGEERAEGKILLEALDSIPRSFDIARLFYGEDIAPIFEVILPMATDAESLDRIWDYYTKFVVGKQHHVLERGDITVADWIGEFNPSRINVIPLFEDQERLLAAADIVGEYLDGKELKYQRVFLARSDPAMNYGLVSATLLCKIALARLHRLSIERGIPIYPMLGVGSAPFRGNLKPQTVDRVAGEYPSVHTFTIQSAFKYDYPFEEAAAGVAKLKAREVGLPAEIDEAKALSVVNRYATEYHRQVLDLAGLINNVARFVPSRRKRKLHMGVFGYGRNIEGVKLPRAITFTAALYSVGIPPEVLALNALERSDLSFIRELYPAFDADLTDALQFFNPDSRFLPEALRAKVGKMIDLPDPNEEHRQYAGFVEDSIFEQKHEDLSDAVVGAANIRHFLG